MAKKKKTNNYYDEEKVQALLKQFQATVVYEDPEAVKLIIKEKDSEIENMIAKEVLKIIRAIINTYRYYIFEDLDDLIQHASENCLKNYHKFNKSKGTSFSYFSIISKICLLNYTDRRKKHRNHSNVEDQIYLEKKIDSSFWLFSEQLETTLFEIIDESYIGNKRKHYSLIASIIMTYIKVNRKFSSKSDILRFARSYGVKNNEFRAFIKDIQKYNSNLFSILN